MAPSAPAGTSDTSIVAASRSVRVSITETVSLFAFAVCTSSWCGFAVMALGWSASGGFVAGDSSMSATFVWLAVSVTVTEWPSHQFVTYAFVPVRSNVTPIGPVKLHASRPLLAEAEEVGFEPTGPALTGLRRRPARTVESMA
jgi:hypothetical protein